MGVLANPDRPVEGLRAVGSEILHFRSNRGLLGGSGGVVATYDWA